MNRAHSTYKVIFSGSILEGHSKADVIPQFTKAFNLGNKGSGFMQQLFSGKVITLKKGLSHEEAKRYSALLEKLGVDCCIECEHQLIGGGFGANYDVDREKRRKAAKIAQTTDLDALSIIPK